VNEAVFTEAVNIEAAINCINNSQAVDTEEQSQQPTSPSPKLLDTTDTNIDPLQKEELAIAQLRDSDIGAVLRLLTDDAVQPPIEKLSSSSETTKRYWSQWNRLHLIDGVLCRAFTGKCGSANYNQTIIPQNLRKEAVLRCHTDMTVGHLGVKKTLIKYSNGFTGQLGRLTQLFSVVSVLNVHRIIVGSCLGRPVGTITNNCCRRAVRTALH